MCHIYFWYLEYCGQLWNACVAESSVPEAIGYWYRHWKASDCIVTTEQVMEYRDTDVLMSVAIQRIEFWRWFVRLKANVLKTVNLLRCNIAFIYGTRTGEVQRKPGNKTLLTKAIDFRTNAWHLVLLSSHFERTAYLCCYHECLSFSHIYHMNWMYRNMLLWRHAPFAAGSSSIVRRKLPPT